jgi:O-antigen ligase
VWSIWPEATSARFISILCVVAVCLGFCVVGWTHRRFQDVVRPLATALLAASLLFGLVYPGLAIELGDGTLKDAWHGLTAQKNQFGQLSSFAVIFWVHGLIARQVKILVAIPCIILSFGCLLLSRSSTSLIATLFVVFLMFLVMRPPQALRRHIPVIVVAFTLLLVTYALAVLKIVPGLEIILKPITALTGKDLTFSNRSEIWEIVRDQIAIHPLLGSGYGAYWIGPVPWSPSFAFIGKMYFYPTESHNGYLEIVNDLGVLGIVCLLGYMAVFVRQSLALIRIERYQGVLFLCLFFQQAIINLSESVWLQINGAFVFVLMTLAVFSLSRSLVDARIQARYAAMQNSQTQPPNDPGDAPPREPSNPGKRPPSLLISFGKDR